MFRAEQQEVAGERLISMSDEKSYVTRALLKSNTHRQMDRNEVSLNSRE
jgi:hypothetical protein